MGGLSCSSDLLCRKNTKLKSTKFTSFVARIGSESSASSQMPIACLNNIIFLNYFFSFDFHLFLTSKSNP